MPYDEGMVLGLLKVTAAEMRALARALFELSILPQTRSRNQDMEELMTLKAKLEPFRDPPKS